MTSTEYLSLSEAVELTGVSKQTIRDWVSQGRITTGNNDAVLAMKNLGKNGRPLQEYYFRSQILRVAAQRQRPMKASELRDYVRVRDIARDLGITYRSANRIRERKHIPTVLGPINGHYVHKTDVEKFTS